MVNFKIILNVLGFLLSALSGILSIPLLCDLIIQNETWKSFLISLVISFSFGLTLVLSTRGDRETKVTMQDTFLLTTLSWIVICIFGALPFYLSSFNFSLTDSIFESMSGVTTTGSTIVNNVETVSVVPTILRKGSKWFSSLGKPKNTGTKIFCISGNVNKPCNVEEEMGVPLKDLIETHAGGVVGGWENLQAVIPGGSSMPLLNKEISEKITMDFDSLVENKSGLGTAGIVVINKDQDIIKCFARIARFYKHESCGQCTPCREGSGWMWRILERMAKGEASREEVEMLFDVTKQIEGHTICAFGEGSAWPVQGLLRNFKKEIIKRNNFDPLIRSNKDIPYLVDQHLLEKDNAQNKS